MACFRVTKKGLDSSFRPSIPFVPKLKVLTNAGLADILDKLPVMPNNEVIIVLQNWLSYEPMFSVGLSAFEFENLIVTRPRFNSAQLCWNSQENGGVTTATC